MIVYRQAVTPALSPHGRGMPGTGTCHVMNARKVAWRVICKELERVSVCVCLRVHACARVLEHACVYVRRAYSRCCRSSGPLGQPPPSGDTSPSTVWRVRYVSSNAEVNSVPHPSDTVANLGMYGRACCVRVCMRERLWVLTRLCCRYERTDVCMVVPLCVYA